MEINITGRNLGITDRFRSYATEKSEKVSQLADRALALEVKVCRHNSSSVSGGDDRVELTLIGPGPIVRAESAGSDKYVAFDLAMGKLMERLRRARDRRKVHRGQHRPVSLREASTAGFSVIDVVPAEAEIIARAASGSGGLGQDGAHDGPTSASANHSASSRSELTRSGSVRSDGDHADTDHADTDHADTDHSDDDWSPVVIRKKVFAASPMTVDDALYLMELVGHDFYLFIDAETSRPSVVYRRKGWDYGVIGLDDHTSPVAAGAREAEHVLM